jgi:hypothetical protein
MSTTVTVSNSVQFAAALKAAATTTTPETILLEAGTYSAQTIWKFNPSANITIESASSTNKAVIDSVNVVSSSNITFNDLTFTTSPTKPTGDLAYSNLDSNVNFTNDNFIGRVSDHYSSEPTFGVVVRASTNTNISGSVFQYIQDGVADLESNNITVSGNSFSNIFGDGIDNAASWNVKLLNNSFTNLHIDPSDAQHSDAIQFWTSGETTAGGNITISGNDYNIGSGGPAQGIFMTDQVGDLTYENVTIENNDLVGTSWNGITLQHVGNALVENNTLQSVSSTGQTSRLTLDGGVSGLVENNRIGQLLNMNGNSARVTGNTILPPIALSAAAQALVSGIASIASTARPGSVVPFQALASDTAYLAGHPISIPKA